MGGIHGSFKNTCEITLKVVRDNKDSLMAVLEAFVYDPLISWRLMQADVEVRQGVEFRVQIGLVRLTKFRA